MADNPSFYDDRSVTLRIVLPLSVAARLATYRREMHPDLTDAQVVEYLVRDDMERLEAVLMHAFEDAVRGEETVAFADVLVRALGKDGGRVTAHCFGLSGLTLSTTSVFEIMWFTDATGNGTE